MNSFGLADVRGVVNTVLEDRAGGAADRGRLLLRVDDPPVRVERLVECGGVRWEAAFGSASLRPHPRVFLARVSRHFAGTLRLAPSMGYAEITFETRADYRRRVDAVVAADIAEEYRSAVARERKTLAKVLPAIGRAYVMLPDDPATVDESAVIGEVSLQLFRCRLLAESAFLFARALVRRRCDGDDEVTDEVMSRLVRYLGQPDTPESFRALIRRCVVSVRASTWSPRVEPGSVGVLEAARRTGVPKSTLYRAIRAGQLKAEGAPGRLRIAEEEIERFERGQRRKAVQSALIDSGLKRHTAYRRIKRAERRLGKPVENFNRDEVRSLF